MTICTTCLQVHNFIRPHRRKCDCHVKTIPIHEDLFGIVIRLTECGFKVVSADCTIYNKQEPYVGKITQIQIEFGDKYPEAMFLGLPPDCMLYDYYKVDAGIISEYKLIGLCCTEHHPECEMDDESVMMAKRIMITNLESWLDSIDSASFYAVWKLAGILL